MMKLYALLSFVILSGLTAFGQIQEAPVYQVPSTSIDRDYIVRGCCPRVFVAPRSCSNVDLHKVEKEETILDITDPELSGLSASPNPTKGILNVEIPANLIGFEIQIVDMTGRFIGAPTPITGTTVQLYLEGDAGIYLISIRTDKEIITERIFLDN